jgi:hypothetical protein
VLVWTSLADILYSLIVSEAQARVFGVQQLLRLSRLLRLFKLVKSIKVGQGSWVGSVPGAVCHFCVVPHLLVVCDGPVPRGGGTAYVLDRAVDSHCFGALYVPELVRACCSGSSGTQPSVS